MEFRVVKCDWRYSTQHIQKIAFLEDVAVQSLSPRMMGLVVGSPGWEVGVGVAIDADKETLLPLKRASSSPVRIAVRRLA